MMETHMVLMDVSSGLTFEKSIKSDKIFQLKKSLGDSGLLKVLIFLIKNLCDSLNLKENMNALQILETANELMERFTHESLDDFILCFKKAKNGEYGTIYNRMDRAVLLEIWAKFLDEKSRFLEDKNLNYKGLEGNAFVGDNKNMPPKAREKFAELLHGIRANYKYKKKEPGAINSLQDYLTELKEWLPSAHINEIEELKKDALNRGFKRVLEEIESFENTSKDAKADLEKLIKG